MCVPPDWLNCEKNKRRKQKQSEEARHKEKIFKKIHQNSVTNKEEEEESYENITKNKIRVIKVIYMFRADKDNKERNQTKVRRNDNLIK